MKIVEIKLQYQGVYSAISNLKELKESVDKKALLALAGVGTGVLTQSCSGDVVDRIHEFDNQIVSTSKALSALIDASEKCLQNYIDSMKTADENAANAFNVGE